MLQLRKNYVVLIQMTLQTQRIHLGFFIDEECGNLIEVNDDGELTRKINQKKKSDVLQQPVDVYSVTNVVGESIYTVIMWNIYCESVR